MNKKNFHVLFLGLFMFISSIMYAQSPTSQPSAKVAVKAQTANQVKMHNLAKQKLDKQSNAGSKTGNAANSSGDNTPVGGENDGNGPGNGDTEGWKNGGGGQGGENGGGKKPANKPASQAGNVMQNNDNPATIKIKTDNSMKTNTQAPAMNQKVKAGAKN